LISNNAAYGKLASLVITPTFIGPSIIPEQIVERTIAYSGGELMISS